jgi:tetratricopeptide (TPR) repeat protein
VEEADSLVKQNEMEAAIILYQKAIKDHPQNLILYVNQAVLFRLEKKYDLALRNYQVAHDLNPQSPIPFLGMGRLLILQNRFSEARDAFEAAIKINPDNGTALFYLGRACFELKDGQNAILALNRALLAKFEPTEIYYYRGRTYEELFHAPQSAITEYELYLKTGGSRSDEIKLRLGKLKPPSP